MALTDFTIITRSLRARLFSTITTVVTVAVAVALMLVLLAMKDSGRRAFERGSGDMHLLVTAEASPLVSVLNSVFYANAPQRALPWSKYEEIARSIPAAYAVPTQLGDSYYGLPVVATTTEFFSRFRPNPGEPWQFADGRSFEGDFEIVVGADAARRAGLRIGDMIYLTHGIPQSRDASGHAGHVHHEYGFTVVGILRPTGGSHDRALFTSLQSSWILHVHDRLEREGTRRRATADDVTPADRLITGIYIRLVTREGSDTPATFPQVYDRLRRDTSITVASPGSQIESLFGIVSGIDRLFLAMAAVVMVSSAIAVMLALYNSMAQRRRQIAILRVLGCSRARIFGLVLTEAAVIGVLGAAAGVALSLLGGAIVAAQLKARLGLVVEPSLPPEITLWIVLATIGLGALAGLVPAAVAYRVAVAKNLRPIG